METKDQHEIRQAVRKKYSSVVMASENASCCSPNSSCCSEPTDFDWQSLKIGYSPEELAAVPEGANLGLGCGNPQAIAKLKAGEIVLDLGSGAGFDAFLAARQVGKTGQVIGVDMTPKMLIKARENQTKLQLTQVDFRLGEIEHLPVADQTVDVIISNCVINLSPEKEQVFREAFRVLKPGGRLAISDIVTLGELPEAIKSDMELYTGCVSGASTVDELKNILHQTGFIQIEIREKVGSRELINEWDRKKTFANLVISASIESIKPIQLQHSELSELQPLKGDELGKASEILKEANLPTTDLTEAPVQLFGLYRKNQLVAVGGLEMYGKSAILRSLAIQKAFRSNGVGSLLLSKIEKKATELQLSDLYLLTTTAEKFFDSHQYKKCHHDSCPKEIQQSQEFASICPSTAICLHKALPKE
ncbi:arsenic resistance N-acetyltransferase ArsN2 [Mangrovibacterium lignilyticum]|uniref:arsenic resistance N-acetyltransferase ArsN2 n=1 Tax=Mangrovibacterium lignilyticum TaxID=2668052 RepID=UPI0013D86921|nr:arsenic resistance N-acetyltransferase ArsN2 [Mangrovibacterium lignilyticum]